MASDSTGLIEEEEGNNVMSKIGAGTTKLLSFDDVKRIMGFDEYETIQKGS